MGKCFVLDMQLNMPCSVDAHWRPVLSQTEMEEEERIGGCEQSGVGGKRREEEVHLGC